MGQSEPRHGKLLLHAMSSDANGHGASKKLHHESLPRLLSLVCVVSENHFWKGFGLLVWGGHL